MTGDRHSTVVGVFEDRTAAQKGVSELRSAGFREDQIGVLSREERGTGVRATGGADTADSAVAEGAATGVIAGAGVGALWALGIVTLGLPAVGPVIAGGIFASILASAAGTAVAGGILGTRSSAWASPKNTPNTTKANSRPAVLLSPSRRGNGSRKRRIFCISWVHITSTPLPRRPASKPRSSSAARSKERTSG